MHHTSIAIFAKGCFWDVEKHFTNVNGVISTLCGYTGGFIPHPSHMEITSGKTGHVHAVKINFDPDIISYESLLDIFMSIETPQSFSPHFQSAIFYIDEEQKQKAISKIKSQPILIKNATTFYPATEFHQHHWLQNTLPKHTSPLP